MAIEGVLVCRMGVFPVFILCFLRGLFGVFLATLGVFRGGGYCVNPIVVGFTDSPRCIWKIQKFAKYTCEKIRIGKKKADSKVTSYKIRYEYTGKTPVAVLYLFSHKQPC